LLYIVVLMFHCGFLAGFEWDFETCGEEKRCVGMETHLRIASDRYDDKKDLPFHLGKDFSWEISLGYLFKNKSFLSVDEWKILEPQNSDDVENGNYKPINPADLVFVLNKIKEYLKNNQNTLPFEIALDYDKMDKEGISYEIIINNSRCWIQGDSHIFEVSSRFKLVNHPMETNE